MTAPGGNHLPVAREPEPTPDAWRLRVELEGPDALAGLLDGLHEAQVAREARAAVPNGVIVSRDGDDVFVYAGSRAEVQAAGPIIERTAAAKRLEASTRLESWHPSEKTWQAAGPQSAATTSEELGEHERLMAEEAQETAQRGYAQWEIDVELPDHHDAREVAERLKREGIPSRHGWRFVRVGAATEDDARALAERLRSELPTDAKISGPLGDAWDAWAGLHPFGALGGVAD